ncbi:MAG: hypothetical protein WCT40_04850, partial [Candidatus Magasanikbacteria bacterium]
MDRPRPDLETRNFSPKKPEKKEHPNFIKEAVDFYISHCLDEDGNLKDMGEVISENQTDERMGQLFSADDEMAISRFGSDEKFKQEIYYRINSASAIFERTAVARLLEYVVEDLNSEGYENICGDYYRYLNGISNHKDTPIFLKLYFKAIIDRSDYNDLLIGSRVATSDQA